MYNQASSSDQTGPSLDPLILVQQMREDGLAMKRSALAIQEHMTFSHCQVSCLIRHSVCIYCPHIATCQNMYCVCNILGVAFSARGINCCLQ
jgi:hypothetical protein